MVDFKQACEYLKKASLRGSKLGLERVSVLMKLKMSLIETGRKETLFRVFERDIDDVVPSSFFRNFT